MKKLVFLFASLFITVIAVQNVNAQTNPVETASAETSAKIIQVISIENSKSLLFGNIIASATGGTVTIGTNGTPSYSGVAAPTGNEGTRQQAIFNVTGEEKATFEITLPTSIEIKSGSDKMTVNSFTSDPNETSIIKDGKATLNVGAKLNVGTAQKSGTYSGTFPVSVNYN